jgi:hypothetical protein
MLPLLLLPPLLLHLPLLPLHLLLHVPLLLLLLLLPLPLLLPLLLLLLLPTGCCVSAAPLDKLRCTHLNPACPCHTSHTSGARTVSRVTAACWAGPEPSAQAVDCHTPSGTIEACCSALPSNRCPSTGRPGATVCQDTAGQRFWRQGDDVNGCR